MDKLASQSICVYPGSIIYIYIQPELKKKVKYKLSMSCMLGILVVNNVGNHSVGWSMIIHTRYEMQ